MTIGGRDALLALVGTEMGPGEWFSVDQDDVDAFADLTRDHQWIHVDVERAREGPYGATIVHGYFTLSLVPALLQSVYRFENRRMGINYGLERVRFPAATVVPARLRATATFESVDDLGDGVLQARTAAVVEREGTPKPVCVATFLSRFSF